MTLESLSASIARRKSRPFAKTCACPQNSSNVRGRIRAASGSRCGDSRLGACVGRSKSDAIKPSSGVCAPPMRFKKSVSYQQFRMIWHSAIASLYAELSRLWLSPYAGYCALWLSPYACHGSAIASLYAELSRLWSATIRRLRRGDFIACAERFALSSTKNACGNRLLCERYRIDAIPIYDDLKQCDTL